MRKTGVTVGATLVVAIALATYWRTPVEGQAPPTSTAAIPSEKGGQDVFGALQRGRTGRSR